MKQVVVLCGGLGTRLRPLTKNIPKAMVDVNGKPFLWYLLNQFKQYGIKDFLLLTGYKNKIISDYFSDGSRWNLNITYDYGPSTWSTSKRILNAKKKISKNFFLIYSDNFVNYPFFKMKNFHLKTKKALTLFLTKKVNGNIKIDNKLKILEYDKLRSSKDLDYVEIGYMAVTKEKFFSYIKNDRSDISCIFSEMIKDNNINALINKDNYFSISDLKRLKITRKFLLRKKIILLDRDGLINKKKRKGEYVSSWKEFSFIQKNIDGLISLSKQKFKFIIITNQAGVGRKKMTLNNLKSIHSKMLQILNLKGLNILEIFSCTHHWLDNCDCRKPKPGLFYKASSKYKFRLDQVIYLGDDPRDCLASFNSGCKSILINKKKIFKEINQMNKPLTIKNNIIEAEDMIIKFYNKSL